MSLLLRQLFGGIKKGDSGIFPALLVICSVVEPTLLKRAPPLSLYGKFNNFPEADMRYPPISIGLTYPADTAGWGKFLIHGVRMEAGHYLNIWGI